MVITVLASWVWLSKNNVARVGGRCVDTTCATSLVPRLSQGAVCPSSKESTDNLDEEQEDIDGSDSSIHELLTPEPPPGIEVTNLLKKFKVCLNV